MSPRILVADDDYDNRTIMLQALEAAGLEVLLAVDGREAVDLALRERPDLIVMDLSMPKLSGWEAAREIRRSPEVCRVPILAFSAHALAGDEAKARAAGCDDYLAKPCRPRQLVEKVRARLGATGGST